MAIENPGKVMTYFLLEIRASRLYKFCHQRYRTSDESVNISHGCVKSTFNTQSSFHSCLILKEQRCTQYSKDHVIDLDHFKKWFRGEMYLIGYIVIYFSAVGSDCECEEGILDACVFIFLKWNKY